MKAARTAWFDGQPALDPARLVFIDETGASTKMARIRGRAKRGERCRAAVPDNLPSHKVTGVRKAIEKVGAQLLYLPPYSPDFNPIEMAFSKLKAFLRKAAARTIDELWQVITESLHHFTEEECRNYFKAAGYDPD